MQTNIKIRGTRREIREQIRHLPEVLSGERPDITGLGRTFKSYFAYYWFVKVREAFLIKSNGGTDDTGTQWAPNAKSTIAQRPISPGDMRKVRGKNKVPIEGRVRGLLTPAQDALWRAIFVSNYKRLQSRVGLGEAKARAAQIAWAILKSRGAQTKIEVFGNRKLPIGQNTGRLLAACSPGRVSDSDYQPPEDQGVTFHHGSLDFEINVPYASAFHRKRRIWPANYRAGAWVKFAARKALEAVVQKIGRTGSIK